MIISDLKSITQYYTDALSARQLFILTDTNAALHCLPLFDNGILAAHVLTISAGEENKNLDTVRTIWDFLLRHNATRNALLLNIGGGVVTDMGGFAAATFKRGIRFVNIPTTLLAMVDASSGGKTGFNFGGFKNAIGTFTPPLYTFIYPPFLSTLPSDQWLSGFAEMLKHALIAAPDQWQSLLAYDLDTCNISDLTPLLQASLRIKQQVVRSDPDETGLRHILNFGHTIGHAVEEAYARQSRPVPHGYCVLWGMIAELYLSVILLDCPRTPLHQLTRLMLDYYGRPACDCRQQGQLISLMRQDKKNTTPATINFTLLRDIGIPLVNQTPSDARINEAIDYLFSL